MSIGPAAAGTLANGTLEVIFNLTAFECAAAESSTTAALQAETPGCAGPGDETVESCIHLLKNSCCDQIRRLGKLVERHARMVVPLKRSLAGTQAVGPEPLPVFVAACLLACRLERNSRGPAPCRSRRGEAGASHQGGADKRLFE